MHLQVLILVPKAVVTDVKVFLLCSRRHGIEKKAEYF
jgi:hypothetical protein